MKKETLQTIAIIVLCLTMCCAGCTSKSGQKLKLSEESKAILADTSYNDLMAYQRAYVNKEHFKPNIVQVVNKWGYVDNVEDRIGLFPALGDTIVIKDYTILNADTSVTDGVIVWGVVPPDDKLPKDIEDDSVYINYYKVRVIKAVQPE